MNNGFVLILHEFISVDPYQMITGDYLPRSLYCLLLHSVDLIQNTFNLTFTSVTDSSYVPFCTKC